jgi:methylated-DNA-[protein]-cysteine S-methyltransferase
MVTEQWDMVSFECGSVAVVTRQNRLLRVCFEVSPEAAEAAVRRDCPDAERVSQGYPQTVLLQLAEFFQGTRDEFDLALCTESLSAFALKTHEELMKVPLGSVVSYGELASRTGSPGAARAVGGVMSSNPFPLVVPCHRVVNANGRVGQYSGAHGTSTKTWLLDFESNLVSGLKT